MGRVQHVKASNGEQKPRILFVSNLFPDSAAPYLGLDNATLLHQLRAFFDIKVICPRPSLKVTDFYRSTSVKLTPRESDMVFDPHFIEVPYVPICGSHFNHRLMRMRLRGPIHNLIQQWAVDSVLCSWLYPDGCAVSSILQGSGVPLVLITQGTDTHQYINHPVRRKHIIDAAERSGAVIARSDELARLLNIAGVNSGKIHSIHNGVNQSIFYRRDRDLCRQQLGLARDAKVIVFVGNFLPVKNPEFLLEAFSSNSISDRVILAMIGKGPLKSGLVKMAENLGIADRVVFTGPLDSEGVAKWMGVATCLCLASHNEGLPNVVIEALASGLPVVASDVGGIGQLVDRPERGSLVPPGDIKGYVRAIVRRLELDDPGTQNAIIGSRFSWEKCAHKHSQIIDSVVNAKN